MVSKREIEDEVAMLRAQLSDAAGEAVEAGKDVAQRARAGIEDRLQSLAGASGAAADEVRHMGDRLLGELRDMPQKKPLLTLAGVFLVGVMIGRMGRK